MRPQAKETKQNIQMRLHQNKNVQRNHQQNKNTTYQMG